MMKMKMFCILVLPQLLTVEQSLMTHSVSFQHLLTLVKLILVLLMEKEMMILVLLEKTEEVVEMILILRFQHLDMGSQRMVVN